MTHAEIRHHIRNRTATGLAILRKLDRTTTDPAVREDIQVFLHGRQ